jgi:uncharacterized protein
MTSADHELTGNDYLSIPFIYADGSIDGVNVLHGGLAGLVEWCGESAQRPLLRPTVRIGGHPVQLSDVRWRRLDRWIPVCTARCTDEVTLTLTVCAPGGYPAARGFFVRCELHNGGRAAVDAEVELEVCFAWSRHWIATGRPLAGPNLLDATAAALVLETDGGRGPALAVLTEPHASASYTVEEGAAEAGVHRNNGTPIVARIRQTLSLTPKRPVAAVFHVGAGRERDGAVAAAVGMRRAGAAQLLRQARLELSHTLRAGEDHRWGDTLNRNLLFNRYYATGRGIDDDQFYLLRSRATRCPEPALFNEREALLWTIPALILADQGLAREALFRVLELFSDRAGEHRRYLDGGSFDSAFVLDQYLLYPWLIAHYTLAADDPSILEEPLVRQVLYEADSALFTRLHPQHMLAATDLLPSGDPADHPYTTFGNALLWSFCDALPRIWQANGADAPPPRFLGAGNEVAAAVWQHCVTDVAGEPIFASSTGADGEAAVYDDPLGSLAMLPFFGFCGTDDPVWAATMEFLRSARYPLWRQGPVAGLAGRSDPARPRLAALCADLLGAQPADALDRLLRVRMPGGIAAATYDADTGEAAEPFHGALAGFLAWTLVRAAEQARAPRHPRRR